MQEPRSASTLELVVNEQQMQNMSQIDLRPSSTDANQQTTARLNSYLSQSMAAQQQAQGSNMFSFDELKSWPTRFRENLHTKLDEARAKSETRTDYVVEVIHAFSGIIIWTLCFICTIIVPIILFFIGLVNLDDCADRPSLPYLVLAIGFFMTASNLFNLALALDLPVLANHQFLTNDIKNIIASILNIVLNFVVAFFYILSAYMVYNISGGRHQGDRDSADSTTAADGSSDLGQGDLVHCNATLYNFTFWFITLTLGAFLTLSALATLLFIYNRYRMAIIRGSTPRSHQATNSPTAASNNGNNNPA